MELKRVLVLEKKLEELRVGSSVPVVIEPAGSESVP